MILTTKGRYALNAILEISQNNSDKPVKLADISKNQNISISYLEQIFANLKKAQIVHSVKGPGGGYILNKEMEISANDIMKATGERIKATSCSHENNCVKIDSNNNKCQTHHIWKGLEKAIEVYLESVKISQINNVNHEK